MYKPSLSEDTRSEWKEWEETIRSGGIVLEIRAYRNGNSFWPTFRSSRYTRCVCIAAPCLFSRRIVNETRINCENFNPEKKSTTVSPIRNLFRRTDDKNPRINYSR